MLFKFGKFWKTLLLVCLSWGSYLFFGFEFTVVTILALVLASKIDDNGVLM